MSPSALVSGRRRSRRKSRSLRSTRSTFPIPPRRLSLGVELDLEAAIEARTGGPAAVAIAMEAVVACGVREAIGHLIVVQLQPCTFSLLLKFMGFYENIHSQRLQN